MNRTEAVGGETAWGGGYLLVWPGWPVMVIPSLEKDHVLSHQAWLPQTPGECPGASSGLALSSDAFIQFTSHLLGINSEELKHRPWSIPADGEETRKGGGPAEKHSVIEYKRKKKWCRHCIHRISS